MKANRFGEVESLAQQRITQIDVAAHAGVSTTAVSLVLNNRAATRLSADVVERVRAAAKELGYRPNLTARALSMQRSEIIGFISDAVTTSRFGNDLISGALEEARRHKHVLFIAETGGEADAMVEAVEALLDRQVDGIVFASTRPDRIAVPALSKQTPIVMLNATSDGDNPAVLADEFDGARRIVDVLLRTRPSAQVAIIGGTRDQYSHSTTNIGVQRRLAGVWASLTNHAITPIAEIPLRHWILDSGYEAVRDLLEDGSRPSALICLNDRIAFGAYRALTEAGMSIPQDVSVVSFDDDEIATYLEPKLTTAAFPYKEMGALAVQTLLQKTPHQAEYLVEMPLRIRGSINS